MVIEAGFHAVQSTIDRSIDSNDLVLNSVDMANAFNIVTRHSTCASVERPLPVSITSSTFSGYLYGFCFPSPFFL